MRKLTYIQVIVVALVASAPGRITASTANDMASVTGAAQGIFSSGASLGAIKLDGLDMGAGVLIEPSGSATGVFHVVLLGRSLLGQAQRIAVDGNVSLGNLTHDGQATFSGVASVDLGDGTPPLRGVLFTVTTATNSLVLTLDSNTLPRAQLTSGAVTIE